MAAIAALTSSTSESYFASPFTTTTTGTTQTTTQTQTQTQAQTQDTVQISTEAQAKQLHSQGQSVQAIANDLGTTVAQVNDYLGITVDNAIAQAIASSK